MTLMAVRIQARNVRSLARWSLGVAGLKGGVGFAAVIFGSIVCLLRGGVLRLNMLGTETDAHDVSRDSSQNREVAQEL